MQPKASSSIQARPQHKDAPFDPEWTGWLDFLLGGGLPDGAFGLEWPGQPEFLLEGGLGKTAQPWLHEFR